MRNMLIDLPAFDFVQRVANLTVHFLNDFGTVAMLLIRLFSNVAGEGSAHRSLLRLFASIGSHIGGHPL